jgi:very-short-patch-repair endonuclease
MVNVTIARGSADPAPSLPPFVEVTAGPTPPLAVHGRAWSSTPLRRPTQTEVIDGLLSPPLRTLADMAPSLRAGELERALRRRARPLVTHTIGPHEVDFVWPPERVLVATDGWDTHGNRFAFESDRAQDADLVAQGYVVVRFTWRQIFDKPVLVVTQVAQALALRPAAA